VRFRFAGLLSVYYKSKLVLQFISRATLPPKRVALFPGTWNPPTIAHVEIAHAALREVEEVVWVLPRALPHKDFAGVRFDDRCAMLRSLVQEHARFSAAVSQGGLYVDIAAEARAYFGPRTEILIVLGRDAADRVATWDYGAPGVFDDLVRQHRLLVAARNGEYEPHRRHRGRISRLPMDAAWDEVSSSEVRRRIAQRETWQHLVHPSIAGFIEGLYAGTGKTDTDRQSGRESRPDSPGDRRPDAGTVDVPHRRGPLVNGRVSGARDPRRGQDLRARRQNAS
jgi:nicotinate-nucleotide adenylyltransferase